MSGTTTVKELIKELLEFDMDEPVYIGLGSSGIPSGSAHILKAFEVESGSIPYGVYLVPQEHLCDADEANEGQP